MIKTLPWAELLVTALTLAAGIGVYAYAHRHEASLEESKRRGAELVEALHTYHAEHDDYPDRLTQLVPRYTPAVQPPTWGLGRWTYRTYTAVNAGRDSAGSSDHVLFQLSVAADESGYPMLYYDFAAQRWVLNN